MFLQESQNHSFKAWEEVFVRRLSVGQECESDMNRNCRMLMMALAFIMAGCNKAGVAPIESSEREAQTVALRYTGSAPAPTPAGDQFAAASSPSQRYIAESHKLDVVMSEAELARSWDSLAAFCGTIQCEIVSSSINSRSEDSPPSASISLRVAPTDFQKLFTFLQKLGKISQHSTEREDKTTAVVDAEAKIKNLTSFRDSLRNMLAKPSATIKDVLEIQQQLAEVQSQLDSETTQRKILANETEKIAVELNFHAERIFADKAGFTQVGNAVRQSISVLSASIRCFDHRGCGDPAVAGCDRAGNLAAAKGVSQMETKSRDLLSANSRHHLIPDGVPN